MTGMYEASVKEYLRKAAEACYKVNQSFVLLKNKDSDYAKEHIALAELHQKVFTIWNEASRPLKDRKEGV